MVQIHVAYTEAINPAGSGDVLSRDQIWRGLQRKIRHAEDFVPIIEKTDVLEDSKENEVVRVAHFKDQPHQAAHTVKEICKSYYPTKVDFIQPNGAVITNTVSDGPGLTENDYNMTYTFNWIHDDVSEGSDEHKKLEQQYRTAAKNAVHKSIEALHRMGAAGELN